VKSNTRARIAALAFAIAIGLAPAAVQADDDATFGDAGIGAGSALSSLVYGPVKIAFAVTGMVIGPFAWALSGGDSDVMWRVIDTSVRGDYVVTPSHLRGEQPLEFFGRSPASGVAGM